MRFEVRVESEWSDTLVYSVSDSGEAIEMVKTITEKMAERFKNEYKEPDYNVHLDEVRPNIRYELSARIEDSGFRVDYVVIEAVQDKPHIRLIKMTADTYRVLADGEEIGEIDRDYDHLNHVRWTHLYTGQLLADKYAAAVDLWEARWALR